MPLVLYLAYAHLAEQHLLFLLLHTSDKNSTHTHRGASTCQQVAEAKTPAPLWKSCKLENLSGLKYANYTIKQPTQFCHSQYSRNKMQSPKLVGRWGGLQFPLAPGSHSDAEIWGIHLLLLLWNSTSILVAPHNCENPTQFGQIISVCKHLSQPSNVLPAFITFHSSAAARVRQKAVEDKDTEGKYSWKTLGEWSCREKRAATSANMNRNPYPTSKVHFGLKKN